MDNTNDFNIFEPQMVHIPAGKFLMGSDPQRDHEAGYGERPQHILYLPDYYMAKYPVTNAQYMVFLKATVHTPPEYWEGGNPPSGKEEHPVVYVSLLDAVTYCRWLSKATGKDYRLPSEAEWEKAARGIDAHIYPWGDELDIRKCNTQRSDINNTTPVGKYSPQGDSPYGCADMSGNVWEWTRSLWGTSTNRPDFGYPYDSNDGRENLDADNSVFRMLRGGSFDRDTQDMRCANRFGSRTHVCRNDRGFRVSILSR